MLHRNLPLKIGAVVLAIFLWFWVTMNARMSRQAGEPPRRPVPISTIAARTVPVVLQTEGLLPPGLRLVSVQVEPPMVTVVGAAARVGRLDAVRTDVLDLASVSDGMITQLPLTVPAGIDVANTTTVTATIRVEPTETEKAD